MRKRLDNDWDKVRKVKSYSGNRRKRRPYQRRNIQHEDAAAAADNDNDDVEVEMEFDRPFYQ